MAKLIADLKATGELEAEHQAAFTAVVRNFLLTRPVIVGREEGGVIIAVEAPKPLEGHSCGQRGTLEGLGLVCEVVQGWSTHDGHSRQIVFAGSPSGAVYAQCRPTLTVPHGWFSMSALESRDVAQLILRSWGVAILDWPLG
jgi:hypothetical protein